MDTPRVTFDDLVKLANGELDAGRAAVAEAHLAQNHVDRAAFERVRLALATFRRDREEAAPAGLPATLYSIFKPERVQSRPGWLAAIRAIGADLIFDSRTASATVGFRSAAEAVQLSFSSPAASIDIQVDVGSSRDRRHVMGQVAASAAAPFDVLVLDDGGAVAAQATTDVHGVFSMALAPGTYDLIVHVGSEALLLADVAIE